MEIYYKEGVGILSNKKQFILILGDVFYGPYPKNKDTAKEILKAFSVEKEY